MHVIFNSIDTDKSNSLDFEEIKLLFAQEQVRVSDDNLHHLIDLTDKNNDGVIDWDEFEDAFDEIESIDELVTKWTGMKSIDVGTDLSIASGIHGKELSIATLLPIVRWNRWYMFKNCYCSIRKSKDFGTSWYNERINVSNLGKNY